MKGTDRGIYPNQIDSLLSSNRDQYIRQMSELRPGRSTPPAPSTPNMPMPYIRQASPTPPSNRDEYIRQMSELRPGRATPQANSLVDILRRGAGRTRGNISEVATSFSDLAKEIGGEINRGRNRSDDITRQIMDLANQPDTPGQWISPYSQDYLNQLGGRLTDSGLQAQQQLQAAKQDIIDNYARGIDTRATENAALTNELGTNLSNLNMNYDTTTFGKRAAADASYLDQMAGQNQATDLSYNDKLGQLLASVSANLGNAAREGLLTPKQFIGPQSGISDGDRIKIDLLKDQLDRELDTQSLSLSELLGAPESNLEVTTAQDEVQQNPLVPQVLAQIQDPKVKDEFQNIYNAAGGDVAKALQLLAERRDNPLRTNLGRSYDPTSFEDIRAYVRDSIKGVQNTADQSRIDAQLLELLMGISPTYTGVPTTRTITSKTKI